MVSAWDYCTSKPCRSTVFLLYGNHLGPAILVCVSLDRLLACAIPVKYFGFTTRYAKKLIGGTYVPLWFPQRQVLYVYCVPQQPKYIRT